MKVEFFKPSDFGEDYVATVSLDDAASSANAKLERESQRMFKTYQDNDSGDEWHHWKNTKDKYTALLIDIQLIQPCQHEPGKVKIIHLHEHFDTKTRDTTVYQCECGVRVKVKAFDAVE